MVGFDGKIVYDKTRPDGMPRRLLDVSRITSLGWKPKTGLVEGLELTYAWYKQCKMSNKDSSLGKSVLILRAQLRSPSFF